MMSKQIVTLILCNLALASSQPRGATRYGSAIRGRRRVQEEMGGAGGKDALVGGMDKAGAMDEPGAMQIGADGFMNLPVNDTIPTGNFTGEVLLAMEANDFALDSVDDESKDKKDDSTSKDSRE